MTTRYAVITPAEPPVGSIVEGVNSGNRYQRLNNDTPGALKMGWYQISFATGTPDLSACHGWKFLLGTEGELEDVTPPKTWKAPEMPAVNSAVITPLEAEGYVRIWIVRQDREGSKPYFWTPSISRSLLELLDEFGEFTEWRGNIPQDHDLDAWVIRP